MKDLPLIKTFVGPYTVGLGVLCVLLREPQIHVCLHFVLQTMEVIELKRQNKGNLSKDGAYVSTTFT